MPPDEELASERLKRILKPYKKYGPVQYGLVCRFCGLLALIREKEEPLMRCPMCQTTNTIQELWMKMELKSVWDNHV